MGGRRQIPGAVGNGWGGAAFSARRAVVPVVGAANEPEALCKGLRVLSVRRCRPEKGAGLPPAAPDARIAWPALDAATQANLWPTKSAITSMPARDADVMALVFPRRHAGHLATECPKSAVAFGFAGGESVAHAITSKPARGADVMAAP